MALALFGCSAFVARFVSYRAQLATSSRSSGGNAALFLRGYAQNKKYHISFTCMPQASA
jgi:hypothetical protein